MAEELHTVAESGTYTSTKTGESVELTAGQQITHDEAVDYGLLVAEEEEAEEAEEAEAEPEAKDG
jgi:hypothetical protein